MLSKEQTIALFDLIEEFGLTRKEFASKFGLEFEEMMLLESGKLEVDNDFRYELDEYFEVEFFIKRN